MVKVKVLIPPDDGGLKAFVSFGASTCPFKTPSKPPPPV
jgi:hypothetical protein